MLRRDFTKSVAAIATIPLLPLDVKNQDLKSDCILIIEYDLNSFNQGMFNPSIHTYIKAYPRDIDNETFVCVPFCEYKSEKEKQKAINECIKKTKNINTFLLIVNAGNYSAILISGIPYCIKYKVKQDNFAIANINFNSKNGAIVGSSQINIDTITLNNKRLLGFNNEYSK